MTKNLPAFLLLTFCLFMALPSDAQSRRKKPKNLFGAGVLLGVNAAQIDGDHVSGYKKIGVYGGLRGIVHLSLHSQLKVEILFSQKGSKWEGRPRGFGPYTKREMKLNYMEVPLVFKSFWRKKQAGIYWETGLSFGRKLSVDVFETGKDSVTQLSLRSVSGDIKPNEFNFILGLGYQLENKMAVGLRSTWGLTRIYSDEDTLPIPSSTGLQPIIQMRNYYLTLFMAYDF